MALTRDSELLLEVRKRIKCPALEWANRQSQRVWTESCSSRTQLWAITTNSIDATKVSGTLWLSPVLALQRRPISAGWLAHPYCTKEFTALRAALDAYSTGKQP